MKVSLAAERYARAVFALALEKDAVEEIYQDNLLIAKTCDENRDLRLLLNSPIINRGKKQAILKEVFEKKIHALTMTYLVILVRKNREMLIPAIAREIDSLYHEYRNILVVRFKSPVLPDEDTRKQVIGLMKSYTRSEIELQPEIDDSLIGGFVLSWGDRQYDASIRREIEEMRNAVAKVNLYKKKI